MNITDLKLHHIGVAVADAARAADELRGNGFLCGEKIFEARLGAALVFAEKPDEIPMALLEPADENSPVAATLKESGGETETFCVCYAVPDVEEAIRELSAQGWKLVNPPAPSAAFGNAAAALLISDDAGLIELLEKKP